MITEYEKRIKQLSTKYVTDERLKKGKSQSIQVNQCPSCEFEYKCVKNSMHNPGATLCIIRSTETHRVWLYTDDSRPKVEEGETYGKLLVISFSHKDKHGDIYYSCKCECGKTVVVRSSNLLKGNTTSCGCNRGKSNKKISSSGDVVSKCREETGRKYRVGSVVNPDGTHHVVSTEHHSKVGCKADKLVEVKDEKDPHNPETNYKYFVDSTCYHCGGKLRYNKNSERQCENCDTIN